MAQETKVGLLIGLALILLVGLVLSDLFTGGEAKPGDANTATDFGAEAQAGIYPEGEAANAEGNFDDGSPFRPEPAREYRPPVERSTPTETRGPRDVPSLRNEPPTPEGDTMEASREALTQVNATLEAWRLADAARAERDVPTHTAEAERSVDTATPTNGLPGREARVTTATPTPPRSAAAEAAPPASGNTVFFHYVQANQTLAAIARQHYGNPEFARAIALSNPGKVDREGNVRPGTKLEIPPLGSPVFSRIFEPVHADHALAMDEAFPTLPSRPVGQREAALTEITVEPGDTLSELASEHLGSAGRWDELLEANADRLDSPQALRSGMTLRIPEARQETATATATPRSPLPQPPTPNSQAPANTYTVQAGDNLTRIAKQYLGDGERWDELLEANADQLDRPENLRAGMVLQIPAPGISDRVTAPTNAASVSRPAPSRNETADARRYTVQAGDNLTRIAARQLGDGDRWRELYEANADQLASPDALVAGQTLRLP